MTGQGLLKLSGRLLLFGLGLVAFGLSGCGSLAQSEPWLVVQPGYAVDAEDRALVEALLDALARGDAHSAEALVLPLHASRVLGLIAVHVWARGTNGITFAQREILPQRYYMQEPTAADRANGLGRRYTVRARYIYQRPNQVWRDGKVAVQVVEFQGRRYIVDLETQ